MYELKVTVKKVMGECTAEPAMKSGDYFTVSDGDIQIPEGGYICLWALQSLMPLITPKEREITEDVYNTLLDIVKRRQRKSVKFDNRKTLDVDTTTAGALIKVHDALKPQNQKKYRENERNTIQH